LGFNATASPVCSTVSTANDPPRTRQPGAPLEALKKTMEKTYDPHSIERHWYDTWEREGWFEPRGGEDPYCIMIPPPNVTGSLHMGHAFQDTIMDALTRYHRMRGRNPLWQPGTDHAGIATQMVVERLLKAAGTRRTDIGREIRRAA